MENRLVSFDRICPHCGKRLPKDSEFCQFCGKKLEIIVYQVCPHCGKHLPSDSEFCQYCGNAISKRTNASLQEAAVRIRKSDVCLAEIQIDEIKGNTPIIIRKASIFRDSEKEDCYLRCSFISISQKAISALLLDVICFDVWEAERAIERNVQILDLSANRDEEFGYESKISLSCKETRFVKIDLKRIRFVDGTIQECIGDTVQLVPSKPLAEALESDEFVQQYIRETSQESVSMPMTYGPFWQCACGEMNSEGETKCYRCGTPKQIVFDAMGSAFLSEKIDNFRKKQEELKRASILEHQIAENEKRNKIRQIQNDAIDKRIIIAEKEEKQKSRRKTWITILSIIIVVSVIISLCVCAGRKEMAEREASAKQSRYLRESRNMATDEMEEGFNNVYADVVSIKPTHFIYTYDTVNGVKMYGTERIKEVICQCKTIEGKTVWVAINRSDYPDAEYSSEEKDFKYKTYSDKNPMRLTGEINNTADYVKGLKAEIKDTFILKVKKMEKQN